MIILDDSNFLDYPRDPLLNILSIFWVFLPHMLNGRIAMFSNVTRIFPVRAVLALGSPVEVCPN